MSKLTDDQRSVLKLFARSKPPTEDGWHTVSDAVWPLVEPMPPELVETQGAAGSRGARLTQTSRTLIEWVLT